jgi:DNA-binding response OmpR family regulator
MTAVTPLPETADVRGLVLLVEDDADIAELVDELLTSEGYAVEQLRDRKIGSVQAAVSRLRPDCVLLDGDVPGSYGTSWDEAAWMTAQDAAVPVIMFSADAGAIREAQMNESERSLVAGFAMVVPKPFALDELLRAVGVAAACSPFREDGRPAVHAALSP